MIGIGECLPQITSIKLIDTMCNCHVRLCCSLFTRDEPASAGAGCGTVYAIHCTVSVVRVLICNTTEVS